MRWIAFCIAAGTFLRRVEKSKKNTKDKSGRALIFLWCCSPCVKIIAIVIKGVVKNARQAVDSQRRHCGAR